MSAEAEPPTPATAPKRRGCLKTAAIGCGSLFGLLLVAAIGVWWRATTDITPIDDSDLRITLEPLPAEENASHWLQVATERLDAVRSNATEADASFWIHDWAGQAWGHPPEEGAPPWDDARVGQVLVETEAVGEAIARAVACERAQPFALKPIQTAGESPAMRAFNTLDYLRLAAEWHRRAGRHAEALDAALALLRAGRLLQAGPSGMVEYLIGCQWHHQALAFVQRLAEDPAVPPDQLERAANALTWAMSGEGEAVTVLRVEYETTVRSLEVFEAGDASRGDPPVPANFAFQPHRTRRLIADRYRHAIAVASTPIRARSTRWGDDFQKPRGLDDWLRKMGANAAGWAFYGQTALAWALVVVESPRLDTGTQLTRAVLLAVAHRQRTGRLPESLEALALARGVAVPIDPYDGRSLRYDPNRRLVWSVGSDHVDEGASDPDQRDEDGDPVDLWRLPDPTVRIPP